MSPAFLSITNKTPHTHTASVAPSWQSGEGMGGDAAGPSEEAGF